MNIARPRRRGDVTSESLPDGSAVLYDPEKTTAYPITASAARIWEACDGTRTVAAIVDELAGFYDGPKDVILRDVEAFLQDLSAKQLIETSSADEG